MRRRAAIAGIASVTSSLGRPVRAQAGLPVVRAGIGGAVEDFSLPFYAVQRGFFQAAGVDVHLIQLSGGAAILPAIVSGSVDFGVTNTGAMAQAHLRGLPLYLLISAALYSPAAPMAHIVVAKNAPIANGKDLSGKTIGVTTVRDLLQASAMKLIDRDGGDGASAKWFELPSSAMAAAVETGRVDAAVPLEPFFTSMKDGVRSVGLPYSAVNDDKPFQVSGIVCNRTWADRNPDLAHRVTAAIVHTADWANRNHRAATEALSAFTKIGVDVLNQTPRLQFATKNDPRLIQPVIDLDVHYGFLPHAIEAEELYGGKSFV